MIKQFNAMIRVSEDNNIIQKNFLEALDYVSNLNDFLNNFSNIGIADKDIVYLPSFYGKYVSEEIGRASVAEENVMGVFILKSKLFLEDDLVQKIFAVMSNKYIVKREEDIFTFILKESL